MKLQFEHSPLKRHTGRKYKILQYADDTQLFTLFNEESINAILQTFSRPKFSEVSGLKTNFENSEVLRIGDKKQQLSIETRCGP